ncbi:MAG TPA: prepilin-type N-terminal cleavage/methylation domain-containing protein [Pyrinomonadaceae bacterium]|nr:prepilin-type N-terminal cleavage/methylation domain-containing protein [Pyrinomonadaceae bacterium]
MQRATNISNSKQRVQRASKDAGFTLLETSIALVLLMIVGLGAASLFFYAATNTSTANDRQLAMAVGQQRLEELRSVLFADASLNATAGTEVDVTSAGRPYKVRTVIVDSNVVNGQPTIKTITIRVSPQGAGSGWARTITSLFGSVTLTTQRSTLLLGPNR